MIEFKDVNLVYPNGTEALRNINISIEDGEFVVIVGLSGAGKSTLIKSINRLVSPTKGSLLVDGENILKQKGKHLRELRKRVGIIFQDYNLVPRSNVLKNVLVGRLGYISTLKTIFHLYSKRDVSLAYDNLQRVHMADKIYKRADELSGGEQQRVSIARALTQKPSYILADEPVASLDPSTSRQVMSYLRKINQEDKITTVVNLHFVDMAMEYADRIIGMRDGEIVFDGPVSEVNKKTFEYIYNRNIRKENTCGGG